MRKNIEQLYHVSQKPKRHIIGLMSGTSLDGLDIALCEISGCGTGTKVTLKHFKTVDYPDEVKSKIRTVFAKPQVSLEYLTLLNPWIGKYHGQLINQALKAWQVNPKDIDAIASHGQTIYHCPKHQHEFEDFGNATLQIGDGDHLAVETDILTLSDFRQKHIAAGGEGAPLAQFGDYFCFSSNSEHRVLLNLGGIANITYLPKAGSFNDMLCSDLGPGNTIMDAYMQKHFDQAFDSDGVISSKGCVNQALLSKLLDDDFVGLELPKSTGPEVFNLAYLQTAQEGSNTTHLKHEDVMATLCELSALLIAKQLNHLSENKELNVYASGGGVHNPILMQRIQGLVSTDVVIENSNKIDLDPDAKEAILFAVLANECLVGNSIEFGVSMGKLSFPN
ncbi:anhydro-N-acetylmuramic acid kinase [Pseudoalteromonas phenolica]|uniref:Anhydro-N-acetylmuramic acid kinase n=1 Tax=Pseudoalteromonas phenolica TaxID=161398 RepID=A0A5R9PWI3_9GAMM|nr:anhydro-N-acetylmuramic acid kinase [Pseudoalteromonas phenolica]TLX45260.1 anhydro-N-acetylmuramic acid kinase [Pseudoalteromonas phenolica]